MIFAIADEQRQQQTDNDQDRCQHKDIAETVAMRNIQTGGRGNCQRQTVGHAEISHSFAKTFSGYDFRGNGGGCGAGYSPSKPVQQADKNNHGYRSRQTIGKSAQPQNNQPDDKNLFATDFIQSKTGKRSGRQRRYHKGSHNEADNGIGSAQRLDIQRQGRKYHLKTKKTNKLIIVTKIKLVVNTGCSVFEISGICPPRKIQPP